MTDDEYSYTVKIKRGGGDDVQKCTVTADTIEGLEAKVDNVREKMADWADDLRAIEPNARRSLDDDQSSLDAVADGGQRE